MTAATAEVTVTPLAITPLGGTLEARIDEHLVISLPGQGDVTSAQQLEFAGLWGEIAVHPYVPSIEGYPAIMRIYDPNELTTAWHEDTTHMARPPLASMPCTRARPWRTSRGSRTRR